MRNYLFVALVFFSSCATTQRTDLFFGMSIPGGGEVSEEQWKNFGDSVVTAMFPGGYTEFAATGRWMDTDSRQTISEKTRVLSFIGRKGREREALLDSVISVYIRKFQQQAVLRVDARARLKLISK